MHAKTQLILQKIVEIWSVIKFNTDSVHTNALFSRESLQFFNENVKKWMINFSFSSIFYSHDFSRKSEKNLQIHWNSLKFIQNLSIHHKKILSFSSWEWSSEKNLDFHLKKKKISFQI